MEQLVALLDPLDIVATLVLEQLVLAGERLVETQLTGLELRDALDVIGSERKGGDELDAHDEEAGRAGRTRHADAKLAKRDGPFFLRVHRHPPLRNVTDNNLREHA